MRLKIVNHLHTFSPFIQPFVTLLLLSFLGISYHANFQNIYAQETLDIESLNEQTVNLYKEGKYEEAIPIAKKVLEINEKTLGSDHPDTAACINNLAELYRSIGAYAKAEPLYLRALEIKEKTLVPDHPDIVSTLNNLAGLYQNMGNYVKAEPLYQRALKIREKNLGPDHSGNATILNNLAGLYRSMGEYTKAEPLYLRALKIREKSLGPDHPDTATCMNNLALLYSSLGNYVKAEQYYQRVLKIKENALGPNHPEIASVLNNLAGVYQTMGEYAKAKPLYQRALEIKEKTLGTDHPDVASTLGNLARLYQSKGDYVMAELQYQRALKITEKSLGPEHPDTATSLNNMALFYHEMDDYAKAETLYQRALKIREKILGPDHTETATSLNNLAELYRSMGDYVKAEPLYQRTLKIKKKVLGSEHHQVATCINNIALLYLSMGEYAKAEPLYQDAWNITEKALGSEHPDTATCINNLALLYHDMGKYDEAEQFYKRALKTKEKVLGNEHPGVASTLNNLAELYRNKGKYSKAESLCQRALEICEKVFGPDHPYTATGRTNLGVVFLDQGKKLEAREMAMKAQKAELKTIANILSFTSEQQRLAFQETLNPYTLFGSMGSASGVTLAILHYKGVVLDSLLEDRLVAEASQNPEHLVIIDQLRSAKQRLTQLLLEVPKDLGEQAHQRRETEKEHLSKEVERLEGTLAHHVAGLGRARRALSVTIEQVQKAIPRQTILLELLRYSHYLGANKYETRYGAAVLASSGEPKWVVLGEAAAIEKKTAQYKKMVHDEIGKIHEEDFSTLLKTLYQQLWLPLETAIPKDTKNIIISPDGELNFVSFATLLTPDNQFIAQKYSISYVASGRDLLRDIKPTPTKQMIVYANPDFSGPRLIASKGTSADLTALRSLDKRDLQCLHLDPLPWTGTESAFLESCAKKWNWPIQIFKESHATEDQLQLVRSPHVLHLATHGFFLPESDIEELRGKGDWRGIGGVKPFSDISLNEKSGSLLNKQVILKNPMHRSGLALVGAQVTLDAWKKGEVPPTNNDGIVTAEEVGGLKLENTWLVVLSACDTGTGEANSGEGVMGLRRGFIQAGTQNLLMTLWSVTDEDTAKFMVDFYETVHKSGNAPQALADVQREWLIKLRKERGLPTAVILAGPFIMSSQGPR